MAIQPGLREYGVTRKRGLVRTRPCTSLAAGIRKKYKVLTCFYLIQARGIGAVGVGLRKAVPDVDNHHKFGRTWLNFATDEMVSLI
jgi:hypothetical protein